MYSNMTIMSSLILMLTTRICVISAADFCTGTNKCASYKDTIAGTLADFVPKTIVKMKACEAHASNGYLGNVNSIKTINDCNLACWSFNNCDVFSQRPNANCKLWTSTCTLSTATIDKSSYSGLATYSKSSKNPNLYSLTYSTPVVLPVTGATPL